MSSIPTVKADLVSLLTEALPTTQVIYGPRDSVTSTGPRILTVGGATGRTEFTSIDMSSATETYSVELVASVSLSGSSQQRADEAALADFYSAMASVNGHHFGEQISVQVTGDFQFAEAADQNGRHAAVRFTADVYAVV